MRSIFSLFFILAVLLAACAPAATPPPATEPPATEPPAAEPPPTEAPVEAAATSTLAPVEFAGPPMEVGSKFTYVDGSILVAVPAGEFIMGHGGPDNPEHTVFLSDFWFYRAEVTNGQYALCVAAGQCAPPDLKINAAYDDPLRVNDPVVGVDYEQSAAYCGFVHGRLPTEAEWEKAHRGPEGNINPWGDGAASCELANLADCVGATTDVAAYPEGRSFYDALGGAGNVYEVVADWYKATYYGESPAKDPFGPETGEKRSVRSSSYASPFFFSELARRYSVAPTEKRADLGFRCVVMDPLYFAPYCEYLTIFGLNNGVDPKSDPKINVSCPSVSISQSQYCGTDNTPLTNVQFSYNPADAVVTINVPPPPTCIPAGGNLYTCNAAVGVSICGECTVTVNEDPQCPPGYHLAGTTCVPDHLYPGQCLPGVNYDPEKQCCSAQTLVGGVNPPCPSGTYYFNPPGACLAVPGGGTICDHKLVELKDCTSDGEDCVNEPNCGVPPRCGPQFAIPCCCP